jgi:flagellar biosynthesis/type III secretory pathway chaperone
MALYDEELIAELEKKEELVRDLEKTLRDCRYYLRVRSEEREYLDRLEYLLQEMKPLLDISFFETQEEVKQNRLKARKILEEAIEVVQRIIDMVTWRDTPSQEGGRSGDKGKV